MAAQDEIRRESARTQHMKFRARMHLALLISGLYVTMIAPAVMAQDNDDSIAPAAPAAADDDADREAAPAAAASSGDGAAASAAASPAQLKEMTVTATREVANIQDVPISVTRFSDEKLDALNTSGQDYRVLAGQAPSLFVESSNGRALPRFYIRGYGNTSFSTFASQPVGLVYDGVVQNNAILKGFPMFDMEDVEVLRGPQGTLYGRNTPAGVVKFESRKPTLDSQKGYFQISDGTDNTGNVTAAYNMPIGDHFALRAAVIEQHKDDWIDNTYKGINDALGGYDDRAFRLQGLYKPNDDFSALINVHGRDLNGTSEVFRANAIRPGSNGDLVSGFDSDKIATDGDNYQDLSAVGSSARLTWHVGDYTLKSTTAYEGILHYRSRGDIDGGNVNTTPFSVETGGPSSVDQFTQAFRLASDYGGRFNWRAGLSYFYEAVDSQSNTYDTQNNGALLSYDAERQTTNAGAVYLSGTYDVTDRLSATGGVRYTLQKKKFKVTDTYNFEYVGPDSESDTSNFTSLSGNLVYKLTDNTNLYGRAGTGSRAPSFSSPDSGLPITKADKETILSETAGIKSELWDHRVRVDFDIYHYTVDNLQLTAAGGSSNIIRLLNADKAEGYGAETNIEAQVTPRLRLTFAGSYNATNIDDSELYSGGCGDGCTMTDPLASNGLYSVDGNDLPRAPKFVFTTSAEYDYPLSASKQLYFYTDWSYRSKYNIFIYDAKEFTARKLVTGGLRAGYRWDYGKYEIAAYCRNCTNDVQELGAIDFNNLTAFTSAPRTVGALFKVRF